MTAPDPPLTKRRRAPGDTPKESSKSEPLSPAIDAGETAFESDYRPAKLEHWAKYLHWLPHEAACVTCGIDPRSYPEVDGAASAPLDEMAEKIWFRTESFRRAVDVGSLEQLIAPLDAMNLLDGLLEKYPPELREIAESIRPYSSLAAKGNRKRARQNPSGAARFENTPATAKVPDTSPSQTKIIATLHKILLAIAVDKYNFQPERVQNPTAGRIHGTMVKHGFKMDVGTIRDQLQTAARDYWEDRGE